MKDMGIDDESRHPGLCTEVAGGVTRNIVGLFREPDAGNLPVRFDEREQETEPSQTGLRRRRENFVNSHREAKATAPVLDSTPHSTQNGRAGILSAIACLRQLKTWRKITVCDRKTVLLSHTANSPSDRLG
jgi:hypothetical protein